MTKDEALIMAIEALEEAKEQIGGLPALDKLIQGCKEALKPHPDCDESCMYQCEYERKHKALEQPAQEPFGYFKAEPFGWTDCGKDDEGAIALYENPQVQ